MVTQPMPSTKTPITDRYALGKAGEDAAVRCYEELGYRLLGARVRCRAGELDAIMQDPDGTVVFVEVKTRRSGEFGGAEAVTAKKLATMRSCAAEWLARNPGSGPRPVRFDVVDVRFDGSAFVARRYEGVEDGAC